MSPLSPMFPDAEETGEVHGYMCLIDFECELGMASGGNHVYPSLEEVLEHRRCARSCGVVKVAIRALEVVLEPAER